MEDIIRKVLDQRGKLTIDAGLIDLDEDLYRSGLTSHSTVNVMLGLEDAFDIEFPDRLLRKTTFQSIRSIRDALSEVGVAGA